MQFDAVVVGAGPNGLAAAIEIARAGRSVCVVEARDTVGGGARTAELTLPGFLHDVCSAVHPLGAASPFFKTLPLGEHGLEWIHSPACVAHPFDTGHTAVLYPSIPDTCRTLSVDGTAYEKQFSYFAQHAAALLPEVLAPPIHRPRHPFLLLRFGLRAVLPAKRFINRFKGRQARALFTGIAGHSSMPLHASPTAAFGILLGMLGHAGGWPIVKGGSQRLADALASYFTSLGGEIITGRPARSLNDLPSARTMVFDLTPKQILRLAFDRLPPSYRWELQKFRYGPGVFKVDWALSSPIPWQSHECMQAATLHLGGTAEEIIEGEHIVSVGRAPERPFVLLSQPSLFDPTRAPEGKHTAWAYCHVPNNSTVDMTQRIESQVERFAPGFRDCILERHTMTAQELEAYNPNYIGGDITGGLQSLLQIIARPSLRIVPYSTPDKSIFICSSSTPPGGGVHGMCGFHAARAVLSAIPV
jgi:phytoene dehydrogenase-like protein